MVGPRRQSCTIERWIFCKAIHDSWRDGLGALEKGPLECGLSKPIMGFQSPSWAFVSRKMAQKSGGHFSEKKKAPAATYPQTQGFQKYGGHFSGKKKAPAATYPQAQGFQKYGGHFSEKKRRLRQRTHKFRASKHFHPHPQVPQVKLTV